MNFKLALSALALGVATMTGCAASSSDDAAASSADLSAPVAPVATNANVVGAYRAKPGTATAGRFIEGIVFNADGSFFADVNTGIMCIMAPCPTTARLTGSYKVDGAKLALSATTTAPTDEPTFSEWYDDGYSVAVHSDGSITISHAGNGIFANELVSANSYCAAATDCGDQGLMHPMCAPGGWTCGETHSCSFSCGFVTSDK